MSVMYPQSGTRPSTLVVVPVSVSGLSWAIPATSTDILGKNGLRFAIDLSMCGEWRFVGNLSAAAAVGAKFRLRYASAVGGSLTDMGTSGDFQADATGGSVGLWTSIPAEARSPVFLSVRGVSGDGLTAAVIENLAVQFR